ncbi:YpdA family putative bacillithiol disulfide reductase [Ferviditalea candida]|uniref:YpdA family putative bacillithiol disulfide reductase n=1 Tax=Ferviditalea candida TaxID=3108399 RepID=A0ABU5ZN26_9BACL|nr:YpdA family putative bacillithiol disulfide reductase [Paenibacillaceae bacterium T2]
MEEVIIVGAGPCGLSAAAELKKRNIDPLIIEKGCVVNSIYNYPTFMQFFSTPELLEIGEVPFVITGDKPTRQEALVYYRTVAQRKKLRIHTYEAVQSVYRQGELFRVETTDRSGRTKRYQAKFVIIATGYFDNPNVLDAAGAELPKVIGQYKDAHPYSGTKVAVVGGNNSAVDAAMDLEKAGADVTVIYRGNGYSPKIKPWVLPLFESLVNKGRIKMHAQTVIEEIREDSILINTKGERQELENDYVFTLIGYRPDHRMLKQIGVGVREDTGAPVFDEATYETNLHNLFIAGVIAAGKDANSIFIENGKLHGAVIAEEIVSRAT